MKRKEEFLPNGKRVHVTPAQVIECWARHTNSIATRYAVGTAQHETNFTTNEKDTEPSGYVSMGIFQLGDEEKQHVGMPQADLYDLEDSVIVMAAIAEERFYRILAACGINAGTGFKSDVWAYLALAHNQGLSAALKTIRRHGLDWAAYKARNPALAQMGAYGDDCITGGPRWVTTS